MNRRQRTTATTSRPLPAPWVGYLHSCGEQTTVPLGFDLPESLPGAEGAADTGQAQVALWRYRPDPQSGHQPSSAPTEESRHQPDSAPAGEPRPPRLLLIHGFRGDHHGLQLIVDALPEYEVLVPDLPGFGQSPPVRRSGGRGASRRRVEHSVQLYARVIDALADQLDLGAEDVLMGHSFGTTLAAAHAAQTQRRWAGLVLSAPISESIFAGRMLPGAAAVELLYRIGALLPERGGDALLRSAAVVALTNQAMTVETDPLVRAYIRDQHRRYFSGYTDRATLLDAYRASSRRTVADYAAELDMPVLLLPGTKDQLSTESGRRSLRDRLQRGRMEVVRGTGHLLHYERPAQAARAIRRFITGL